MRRAALVLFDVLDVQNRSAMRGHGEIGGGGSARPGEIAASPAVKRETAKTRLHGIYEKLSAAVGLD